MRTILAFSMMVSLSLLCLYGCGGGGGSPVSMSVAGYLVDAGTRTPLGGATVSAQGQTIYSESNGYFTLTRLTRNPVVLTIRAAGHEDLSHSVTVVGGSMNVGTLALRPLHTPNTGNVTGYVTLNGAPAASASVVAGTREARTSSEGGFTLFNVPPGTVTLTAASADRVFMGSGQVTVVADTTVSAGTIQLISGPPPPPI
ncbi:MAG: carboxypeptidase-like regulatory domain-containing protein [candidate division WS1 bacterium]|nr:carboxypeptidase-like regulatory domain-containing protein [candidate division WS1 bacterium]